MVDLALDADEPSEEGYPVELPSGAIFRVLTPQEVEYIEERSTRYQEQFRFENVSDLQDVDRIVVMELLVHRWSLWISRMKDYFGDPIEEGSLRKSINDYSGELRAVKKSIGMDKVSRDKERGEDSVAAYLEKLRHRAKEFGVNRENMMDRGLELFMQVIAVIQLWHNSDEQERLEFHCTSDDVCKWLFEEVKPAFEEVDLKFRQTKQKYWIADQ